jgi:SAM-dependent methyltransferase
MFFPDRVAGFREAHRVLRPGGRFLLNMWTALEDSPFPLAVQEALEAAFPDDPPQFIRRTPHGHGNAGITVAELRSAGFARVEVEVVTLRCRAASALDPALGFCAGTPVRAEIEARDPSRLHAIVDAAAHTLEQRFGSATIEAPMRANVFEATK